jgi:hypothetical protein
VGYCSGVGEPVLAHAPGRSAPRQWEVGDLCLVAGEGEQVFRVSAFDGRGAVLYTLDDRLHGLEPLGRLSPSPREAG